MTAAATANNTVQLIDIVEGDCGCALCGKPMDRKYAVILSVNGVEAAYGTHCAATLLGYSNKRQGASIIDSEAQAVMWVRDMVASGTYDMAKIAQVAASKFGYPVQLVNKLNPVNNKYTYFVFGERSMKSHVYSTPTIIFTDRKGNVRASISQVVEYDHEACLVAAGWIAA